MKQQDRTVQYRLWSRDYVFKAVWLNGYPHCVCGGGAMPFPMVSVLPGDLGNLEPGAVSNFVFIYSFINPLSNNYLSPSPKDHLTQLIMLKLQYVYLLMSQNIMTTHR